MKIVKNRRIVIVSLLLGFLAGYAVSAYAEDTPPVPVPVQDESTQPAPPIPAGSVQPATTPQPPSFSVEAYVDKALLTIGDKIRYTVKIIHDKDLSVEVPNITDALSAFTIKDFGRETRKRQFKGQVEEEYWYVLDTYVVGAYVIPPITVTAYKGNTKVQQLKTPEIYIEVKSVISDADKRADIRDLKQPVSLPFNKKGIIIIALAVLALGLIGGAVYFIRVRRSRTAPAVFVPPHERAYRELKRIAGMDLIAKGQAKEYYFLISNCLRHYLEARYGFKALEQTTEEFIEELLARRALPENEQEILRTFLEHCDYVKFAKYTPSAVEADKAFKTVGAFVDATKQEETNEDEL